MLTGRQAGFDRLRQQRRAVRLPEPGRVRARPRRELPRLHRAVLRRRPGQGLRAARRGPARRRRGRRRRADRRDGLGGAEQHRRRQATGWSSSSTTTAAPTRRPSAAWPTTSPRCGSTRATSGCSTWQAARWPDAAGRPAALRRAARGQEGHQGRARARRACSRTSASSTSARSTGTTSRPWSRRCAGPSDFGGPVIVHAVTRKGYGYRAGRGRRGRPPAQPGRVRPGDRQADRAGGRVDPRVRRGAGRASARERPRRRRHHRRDAAARPGSRRSQRAFPDRVFDVGIAEQHARDLGGRAGDGRPAPGRRALRDVPQPGLRPGADGRGPAPAAGVTFVLDRAGITGDDGASHHGMWDLSSSVSCPGMRIAAPRDAATPARGAARGGRRRRRADRRPVPEGSGARADLPAAAPGRRGRRAARDRPKDGPRCCWSRRRVRRAGRRGRRPAGRSRASA